MIAQRVSLTCEFEWDGHDDFTDWKGRPIAVTKVCVECIVARGEVKYKVFLEGHRRKKDGGLFEVTSCGFADAAAEKAWLSRLNISDAFVADKLHFVVRRLDQASTPADVRECTYGPHCWLVKGSCACNAFLVTTEEGETE